jgi:hypothetical protein
MNNSKISLGMLVMVLVFGLVLGGCPTEDNDSGPSYIEIEVGDLDGIWTGTVQGGYTATSTINVAEGTWLLSVPSVMDEKGTFEMDGNRAILTDPDINKVIGDLCPLYWGWFRCPYIHTPVNLHGIGRDNFYRFGIPCLPMIEKPIQNGGLARSGRTKENENRRFSLVRQQARFLFPSPKSSFRNEAEFHFF